MLWGSTNSLTLCVLFSKALNAQLLLGVLLKTSSAAAAAAQHNVDVDHKKNKTSGSVELLNIFNELAAYLFSPSLYGVGNLPVGSSVVPELC